VVIAVTMWGCSNNGTSMYGGGTTNPTPVPSGATTISIQGQRGNQSFSPNPGSVAQGKAVAWTNTDSVTHRIVANDGSFDTGNIAPGNNSAALMLNVNGANYHCSIHPAMVGSINTSSGTPPPCSGAYCP
jgi:plastocyanin